MANNDDIQRFLHYIKQLESSGGKNLDHPVIQHGIHAGESAQGAYAVMPNTMEELQGRFPSSFNEKSSPDDYAKKLADMVLDKSKNDETLAAGLYNQGHNASPDKFPDIRESDYAQKYDDLRKEIPYSLDPNPYQKEISDEEKANSQFPQLTRKFFNK